MDDKNQTIEVNFESHPPIESDSENVARLLQQTFLKFVDCQSLAEHLVGLKEISQVICLEATDEENISEDEVPDDDIYGVTSIVNLSVVDESNKDGIHQQLKKFLSEKCPDIKDLFADSKNKLGLIINERFMNLPPQLALPTLENLTKHIQDTSYSHLIFVSKILKKCRNRANSNAPNKKAKSSKSSNQTDDEEPLVFVNSEEEIVFEQSEQHIDLDVSSYVDENATWSMSNSTKYIPHRRFMILKQQAWSTLLKSLREELSVN